jgi:iron complex outermembrane receptor protein
LIYNAYRKDKEDDDDSYGFRFKYLFEPLSDLKFVTTVDYSADDQTAGEGTILSAGRGSRVAIAAAGLGIVPGPNNIVSMEGGPQTATPVNKGVSVEGTYTFHDFTLTSISAYRDYDITYIFDPDGSPATITEGLDVQTESQISQEFRVASPSNGFVDYVGGLFFFRKSVMNGQTSYGTFNIPSPPRPDGLLSSSGDVITDFTNKSYAGFGRLTAHLTEKLNFIAGARYTFDDYYISNRTDIVPQYAGLPPTFIQGSSTQTGSESTDNLSWQTGLQYKFSDGFMAYATASRGYKGPVPLTETPTSIALSKPEVPTSYEAGIKSSWLDHLLVVNADVFHAVYRDFQAAAFDFQAVPPVARITNAGSLVTKGVEFSVTASPVKGLTVSTNVDYLDAYYKSFVNDSCWLGQTLAEGCVPTGIGTAVITNSSGHSLANAPRWTASMFTDYSREINSKLNGFVSGNFFHKTAINWTSSDNPFTRAPGYSLIGLSAGVGNADDKWSVRVFVKNLLDKRFASRIQDVASGQRGDEQQYFDQEAFRFVGISLDMRY